MGPESQFEQDLRKDIEALGGIYLKFKASEAGWMDRIILMPLGWTYWVELKRPDGKGQLSKLQKFQRDRLVAIGHDTCLIETEREKQRFLERIKKDQLRYEI